MTASELSAVALDLEEEIEELRVLIEKYRQDHRSFVAKMSVVISVLSQAAIRMWTPEQVSVEMVRALASFASSDASDDLEAGPTADTGDPSEDQ